jgi:hypothetical protein
MARRRGAQQRADNAKPNECFHGLTPQNRRKTKTAVALFDAIAVRFPLKPAGSSVPGRCWMQTWRRRQADASLKLMKRACPGSLLAKKWEPVFRKKAREIKGI